MISTLSEYSQTPRRALALYYRALETGWRCRLKALLTTLAHPTPSLVNPPESPVRSSDLLGGSVSSNSGVAPASAAHRVNGHL